jgi:hypothetical protein
LNWDEEIRQVLEGNINTAYPQKDLTETLRLDSPTVYHPLSGDDSFQARFDYKMDADDADAVGTKFEHHTVDKYSGDGIDRRERDVELGIESEIAGWPVQVKSCRFTQSDGSNGKFVMRENEDLLPDKSISVFYVYRLAGYEKGGEMERFIDYDRASKDILNVDYKGSRFDVEKLGETAVLNAVLKQEVGIPWWNNGRYGMSWPDVFGREEGASALDQGLRQRFSSRDYCDITEY